MQPGWIMDLYAIRADYDMRVNTGKSILHQVSGGPEKGSGKRGSKH